MTAMWSGYSAKMTTIVPFFVCIVDDVLCLPSRTLFPPLMASRMRSGVKSNATYRLVACSVNTMGFSAKTAHGNAPGILRIKPYVQYTYSSFCQQAPRDEPYGGSPVDAQALHADVVCFDDTSGIVKERRSTGCELWAEDTSAGGRDLNPRPPSLEGETRVLWVVLICTVVLHIGAGI